MALVLLAIMVYRATNTYHDQSGQPRAAIVDAVFDETAAVQRCARSLTYPTISHDDRSNFDAAAFIGLHEFLQTAYPLVHERMQRTVISGYSLVFPDNVYRFAMIRVTSETVRYVHGIDERLPVEDYLLAIRFYYNLLMLAAAE